MKIIRLDYGTDFFQRHGAVRLQFNWLWLDAAKNSGTAALIFVGMGLLADDIFLAALAVTENAYKID